MRVITPGWEAKSTICRTYNSQKEPFGAMLEHVQQHPPTLETTNYVSGDTLMSLMTQ